ncbi:hypothetical protein Tco_0914548 [Tanacetum coccineum]
MKLKCIKALDEVFLDKIVLEFISGIPSKMAWKSRKVSDEDRLKLIVKTKSYANGKEVKKFFKEREDLYGDPNNLIGECSKPPKINDQKAFIGGAWSDNREDEVEKTKDKTCLVAQAPDEICLGIYLDPMSGLKIMDDQNT